MTAITPGTFKNGWPNERYNTKDMKNWENDQVTAITPLDQKISSFSNPCILIRFIWSLCKIFLIYVLKDFVIFLKFHFYWIWSDQFPKTGKFYFRRLKIQFRSKFIFKRGSIWVKFNFQKNLHVAVLTRRCQGLKLTCETHNSVL